jgi:hypothetical protein
MKFMIEVILNYLALALRSSKEETTKTSPRIPSGGVPMLLPSPNIGMLCNLMYT